MLADLSAGSAATSTNHERAMRLVGRFLPVFTLAASRGGAILAQFFAQLAVGTMLGAAGLGVLQLFTAWTCIAGEILGQG